MLNKRRSRYVWVVVAYLFAMLAQSLTAQTASTGAIKGTVTDSSGAVVPNATIDATNNGTGLTRTVTSATDGSYIVPVLPLGTYRLKVEASGFKPEEIPSITVNVSETAVFNPILQVGGQTQEITVRAEAEALQTTNATMGTVVASDTATALPLTTRNYTNLLGLSTGANTSVFNATALGKGTTDLAVNGADIGQNGVSMDGVTITNNTSNGLLTDTGKNPGLGLVNPDAIQEFKIQTSLFDAGYGRNVGANTNVVTKSGTNEFHGAAFEFFRNTVLNANDFFRKESLPVNGVPNDSRQVLNQNQFGGVIGGPIKKDKLFFFGSFQELSQRNGIAAQGYSTPFLLPIFPGGDRSNTAALQASLGATFCPTGTDGGKSGAGGTQVACNGSNINPVAIALLQFKNPDGTYYIPSGPATITSSTGSSVGQLTTLTDPARFTEHQYLANGDYVINSKNTFSVRYFYTNDPEQISFLCGISGGAPGNCYVGTTGLSNTSNHYAVLKLTSILTNNLVNEARVSLQRTTSNASPTNPYTDAQFGIQPIQPSVPYLDQITVTGLFTVGTAGGIPSIQAATNWELGDDLSWTHGKHTIRFGGEMERDAWNTVPGSLSVGSLSFKTFQDFLLGLPGCAPGLSATVCAASAAAGQTNGAATSNISSSGGSQSLTPPGGLFHYYRDPFGNAYFQDDIKLTPRFTLNVGLRWEYDSLFYDKEGLNTNVWPSLVSTVPIPGSTPATGTLAGITVPSNFPFAKFPAPPVGGVFQLNQKGATESSTPLDDFGPRVAFAWSPLANRRLVLRSGFGTFYDRAAGQRYVGGINQAVPYATPIFSSGAANYYSSFAVPYQGSLGWNPRWINFATSSYSGLSETSVLPNYTRTPRVYQWNLTAQYEFIRDWTLELGYVASRGVHEEGLLSTGHQGNEAQLVGNPLATNTITAPAIAAGLVTTNTVANAFERVPYLGFQPSGLSLFGAETDTKYNSLQATLRKQLTHGLQVQAAYTWSRAFANDWAYNDQNVFVYSPNPQYRPQRLAISYLWNLPTVSREDFLGKVANGWAVSGVTVAQDGLPLTIINTTGGSIFGYGPGSPVNSTAEFCPGMGPANVATPGSVAQRLGGINGGPGYFNKAAFCSVPTIGGTGPTNVGAGTIWGNAGQGIILGPGQFNWDMSLIKTTKVGGINEGATLQFRADFFNAFNHPQFNPPGIGTSGLSTGGGVDSSNSTFGQITSASVNPRLIQFGLKYLF
jgi:hypothetical protein